jgi:hypothetical protein
MVLLALPVASHALLIERLGGAAYYDTVLDITWLADANLAESETFGVAGIDSDGSMNWDTANDWIAAMNADSGTGYLGFNDWRLPSLSPVSGGAVFNTSFSNNGSADFGYGATGVGWETLTDVIVSEMGYMYYGNLANLGLCTPNDASPSSCTTQAGWGLANTDSFDNVQSANYWSGVEFGSLSAWSFYFDIGYQDPSGRIRTQFAWAVRPGDVGVDAQVPEPASMLLCGIALAGAAGARRRASRFSVSLR